MSITDDRPGTARDVDAHLARQPPQDILAEQSVLGAMLLSKDAVADVIERVQVDDFYRPTHQHIYLAILDLFAAGEPADAVTIAAELDRRKLLTRIGGAPYLHTLIATVPTAANANYYAGIVAEKALLRRLIQAGVRLAQYGYAGAEDNCDVDTLVDRAQAEVYELNSDRSSRDLASLDSLLQPTLDDIAAAGSDTTGRGVRTGFTDLDQLTQGLQPGQMITVAARPGIGKALALDTPLPTPTGWTTMQAVAVGDVVLDTAGQPTRIVAATPVLYQRPCYEITFDDGTRIVADRDHEWPTAAGTTTTAHLRPHTAVRAPSERPGRAFPPHTVTRVIRISSVPVRCIQVDNPEHLYLAGTGKVATHNSTLGLDFLRSCSVRHHLPSAIFSLEMSKSEIVMRLLSADANIRLSDIRSGRLSDQDWTRLGQRISELSQAPLYIDDSPNLTLMEIRAKARRLRQRNDLKLIVIDYLQLMTTGRRYESRQQEVSEISRNLKLLAKELELPVVAISQLNRGPEQRHDKTPVLADLRESGQIEQDSDIVMLLHRPDAYQLDDPRAGETDIHIAKNRHGPTAVITLTSRLAYSCFANHRAASQR